MNLAFNLSLVAYLAALVVSVANLSPKRRWGDWVVTALLAAGVVAQTAHMVLRWSAAGRPPFSNMYESLLLFAWAVVAIHLVVSIRVRIAALGVATALLAAVILAYASTYGAAIRPLMPALQSNWLTFHVFTCFLGYGGFAVSFLTAAGYLLGTRAGSRMPPETAENLESVSAKTISFGFLFLTLGIITGAVWANSAWGTYWSWDPKETWSLITWFIYAIYLHCRFMRGWRGRLAAWVSVFGFLSVLFTYVGVNFLMSGLHSYARP